MKKQISLILLAAVLASVFACEGRQNDVADETTAGDTTPEVTTELTDGLPDKNMDGFTFNIHHSTQASMSWVNLELDAEAENGEHLNDAIYKRNQYIEERFKCKLNITEAPWNENAGNFRSIVMAGDNPYDIFFIYGNRVMSNLDSIADFKNVPHINLDAEYWNPLATGAFNVGGKQIAVAGNYTLSYLSSAGCFIYNKRIADENKTGSMYDLVRSGKWTTDKFFEIARKGTRDLDGNGKYDENDQFGIISESAKAFYDSMVSGANIYYLEKDSEGYPVFRLAKNEKGVSFFQKLVNVMKTDPYMYFDDSKDVNTATDTVKFDSGNALFMRTRTNFIGNYREMKDDFGILPIPKYDESQEDYVTNCGVGEIAVLPRSYDKSRLDNVGILLEAMAFRSQQTVVPTYKEVLLQTKFTRDEDSGEMIDIVFSGISFDLAGVAYESIFTFPVMNNIFIPREDVVVSTLESVSNSFEAELEKLKAAVAEMP